MEQEAKMKTQILKEGDGLLLTKNTEYMYLACCDCELTHKIDVKITPKGMVLYFHKDDRRTGQRRRRKRERTVK